MKDNLIKKKNLNFNNLKKTIWKNNLTYEEKAKVIIISKIWRNLIKTKEFEQIIHSTILLSFGDTILHNVIAYLNTCGFPFDPETFFIIYLNRNTTNIVSLSDENLGLAIKIANNILSIKFNNEVFIEKFKNFRTEFRLYIDPTYNSKLIDNAINELQVKFEIEIDKGIKIEKKLSYNEKIQFYMNEMKDTEFNEIVKSELFKPRFIANIFLLENKNIDINNLINYKKIHMIISEEEIEFKLNHLNINKRKINAFNYYTIDIVINIQDFYNNNIIPGLIIFKKHFEYGTYYRCYLKKNLQYFTAKIDPKPPPIKFKLDGINILDINTHYYNEKYVSIETFRYTNNKKCILIDEVPKLVNNEREVNENVQKLIPKELFINNNSFYHWKNW